MRALACVLVLGLLVISSFAAFGAPLHPSLPSSPQPVRLAVPLYIYPGAAWTTLESQSSSVGFVVMNPESGPGTSANPTYAAAVSAMQSAGIQVLGYTPTSWADGSVTVAQDEAWVTDYYAWYGVNGIFFDQAATACDAATVNFYSTLYNYTQAETGGNLVVLNPGTATGACYGPISNVLVTFEDTYTNYTTAFPSAGWTSSYPPSHFWHIVYDTPSLAGVQAVLTLARERGAGWVYATDQGLPNPYGTLPTYWSGEVGAASPLAVSWASAPSQIIAGQTARFSVAATGGSPPYTYTWTGLPAGCASENASSLPCTTVALGTFSITVEVSDPEGASALSAARDLKVVPASSTTPGPDDWTTYLGSVERDGAAPNETLLSPRDAADLTLAWKYTTGGVVAAQPVVSDGVVYAGSWDGNETALNATTGAILWKTFLGVDADPACGPTLHGVESSATLYDGTLYVGGGSNDWYALNATTGETEWTLPTGSVTEGYYDWASPLVYEGNAYLGLSSLCNSPSVQGQLLEVSLATHQVVHTFDVVPSGEVGGAIWTSPSVDPATNLLFISTGNEGQANQTLARAIIALNATTLAMVGDYQVPTGVGLDQDFSTTPTVFRNGTGQLLVEASEKDGDAYIVNGTDPSSGPLWSYEMTDQPPSTYSSSAFDGATLYLAGGPTVIGGTDCGGSVQALDPNTWSLLWQDCVPASITPALTYADGLLFAGVGSDLEVLSASNGTLLYTFVTGSVIEGPAAVSNGCVFFGSTDLDLYALALPGASCAPLTASAWANLTKGPVSLSVAFGAQAHGGFGPSAFSWEFGDGGTSAAQDPVHTYNSTGTFGATVTVTDAGDAVITRTLTVTVTSVPPPLTVSASADPSRDVGVLSTVLSSASSGGTPPYHFAWVFGDGSGGSETQNVSHVYSSPGTFVARVWVNDSAGRSASATVVLTVAPELEATADDRILNESGGCSSNGPRGLEAAFTSTVTGGFAPYTFSWDFGDGSPDGTVQNTTHVYGGTGPWTVTLTVTDARGTKVTSSLELALPTPPCTSPSAPYQVDGLWVLGGAVVLIAVAAVWELHRRRSPRSNSPPEPGPPDRADPASLPASEGQPPAAGDD